MARNKRGKRRPPIDRETKQPVGTVEPSITDTVEDGFIDESETVDDLTESEIEELLEDDLDLESEKEENPVIDKTPEQTTQDLDQHAFNALVTQVHHIALIAPSIQALAETNSVLAGQLIQYFQGNFVSKEQYTALYNQYNALYQNYQKIISQYNQLYSWMQQNGNYAQTTSGGSR